MVELVKYTLPWVMEEINRNTNVQNDMKGRNSRNDIYGASRVGVVN